MIKVKLKIKHLKNVVDSGVIPSIDSPTGLVKITDVYRKYGAGVTLTFNDNTTLKCATEHKILDEKSDVFYDAKDIRNGDVFSGKVVTKTRNVKAQEWWDFSVAAEHETYIHKGLIHHNSGKSAILAMLMRVINVKTLIIVPNISLLAQLGSDLENYFAASGWDIEEHCYFIGDGIKPQKKHQFIISTWQSLQRLPPEWFEDFESIVVDECIHPDSEIQMSDGTTKKIKDVAVGDLVKTVNESTLELEDKPVVEVFKNMFKSESANRLRITTENGEELIITGNHKVFTQRGWVMADDLTEDDSIQRF